jgi:broad specificity phosphatase PhoE
MKLILLRHGETEEEEKKIILGSRPGTLSATGREQAKKIAESFRLTELRPEIILTSDLSRAADYAAIIGHELGLKIKLEHLARERSAGTAEGKTGDEIDWEEYEKISKPLRKHPGGESFNDVRERAKEFLSKVSLLGYGTMIVVSHSVFLAMLAMEVCDWSLEDALRQNFRRPLLIDTDKKGAESFPPL